MPFYDRIRVLRNANPIADQVSDGCTLGSEHFAIGVGTERVSNFADERGIPKIIVINAMDKPNANFEKVLADTRAHYGPRVFPLNVPINRHFRVRAMRGNIHA